MEITTLGTSHGDHTYCRFNSSTLIESNGASYLIDAGAPVNGLLVRAGKNVRDLRAVFITHMHDDHAGGLSGLVKSLRKYPVPGQRTVIFLPEPGADKALTGWLAAQHLVIPEGLITFGCTATMKNGPIYDDGVLKVTPVETKHLRRPDGGAASFAFKLELENKLVMYTGDLSEDFSDFPITETDDWFDLCVCEATHYAPEDALPVLMKRKIKRLVFNHIHNPWHGDGERALLSHYAPLPYPMEIAHDGDVFIL